MKDIRYKHHPGVGGPGTWTHSSLVDFLFVIPYFLERSERSQPMPSHRLLNTLFMSGNVDAGMSGGSEWKPFAITPEEYRELAEELLSMPGTNFIEDPSLATCTDLDEWRTKVIAKYRS